MDPITITFYALVCGALSAYAPPGLARILRFLLGVAVGVLAAIILPLIKSNMGY
jgi:hypothetical protein